MSKVLYAVGLGTIILGGFLGFKSNNIASAIGFMITGLAIIVVSGILQILQHKNRDK